MSSIQPKGQSFHHTGVSTFAIRTSQRTDQNCKRAFASASPREEFQNFSSLLKRKNQNKLTQW